MPKWGSKLCDPFLAMTPTADGPCWLWPGKLRRDGYGNQWLNGKCELAHRAVYVLMVGPVPDGTELDHLCRNRACVNPAHMEPVTHKENVLRGDNVTARNARATHCKRGHEFTPGNTLRRGSGRTCKACVRISDLRRRPPKGRIQNTHCRNGHEYAGANLVIRKRDGRRCCRECLRRASREFQQRKRRAA